MFLTYIDETGDESCVMHSALLIPADRWASCLNLWLSWRATLNRVYHVPASFELHASPFLAGKFEKFPAFLNHKTGLVEVPKVNDSAGVQMEVIEKSIQQVGRLPYARLVTSHTAGTDRMASYRDLLAAIESFLEVERSHALLMVDGLDAGHKLVHRDMDLKLRRILEDPWMHDSEDSQFIQAVDLAAYAALQCVRRRAEKRPMWEWYEAWLAERLVYAPGCPAGIYGHPQGP
ncbi:MAG: hypothetical protein QOJ29_1794 [Thermoleophilaceae bacterium]|nr:hypothetical protein [Thermoleophilaceae bacterium]